MLPNYTGCNPFAMDSDIQVSDSFRKIIKPAWFRV
jgi:hypothetical protein